MSELDVVVLQCGQPELTIRLLESMPSAHDDLRVILVDNGSDLFELATAVDALRKLDVEHMVIANPSNYGFAVAVNQGLRFSTAPYVCIQNNDTVMDTDGYVRMIAHLEADPMIGLIGPLTDHADSIQRADLDDIQPPGSPTMTAFGLIAFFCTLMRRDVLETVGLLSEEYGLGYGEDNDYCIRVRAAGYRLAVATDVFVQHDHHATYERLIGMEGIDELGRRNSELLMEKFGRLE